MGYGLAHTIHLICAILFIGVVAFEVLIIEGIRPQIAPQTMGQLELLIQKRGRRIMPFVVIALVLSGLTLGYHHRAVLMSPLSSSFGTLLSIKLLLVVAVLVQLVMTLRRSIKGTLDSGRFKLGHRELLIQMFVIVILAKAMFYVSW
ncbi:hypothetical protein DV711_01825 [Motiliproteus coralliicola]|uniref:Copper resistance protein D domain-containing protein n=1 Tax=Motiliproteus coralliicola TaxID=2283196 RepID=A0A369WT79_9GAMM|nr:hypothetical protein [Motiliproteus coralliicola]RDE24353.1 hypothetical protein DV711_01825 [Motiliproteus coralliicola]